MEFVSDNNYSLTIIIICVFLFFLVCFYEANQKNPLLWQVNLLSSHALIAEESFILAEASFLPSVQPYLWPAISSHWLIPCLSLILSLPYSFRNKLVFKKRNLVFIYVTLETELTFTEHVNEVCNKANKSLSQIHISIENQIEYQK